MPVRPYFGKYQRDRNETWFIDRQQWGKGQCTKKIILTCILTDLSPHNHVFIIDACLGHILESTKGIEIKLGTYIDVNERKCRRQEP